MHKLYFTRMIHCLKCCTLLSLSYATIFTHWTLYTDNNLYKGLGHIEKIKAQNVKYILMYLEQNSYYLRGFIQRNLSLLLHKIPPNHQIDSYHKGGGQVYEIHLLG